MPYIKPERRPDLDPILQKLWYVITIKDGKVRTLNEVKGDINYSMTKLLITALAQFGTRYHILSAVKGIPADVRDEFHDRFMRPYENIKIKENGVVHPLEVSE